LFAESVFAVPYRLPSGRIVTLRGKFDSVDLIGLARSQRVYLQENKAKGDIDELMLRRQLQFDLQTMLYLVALRDGNLIDFHKMPIGGVRYNVIRRPLSGGKGSIKPHKEKVTKKKTTPAETKEHFYKRLAELIEADCPTFFMRWKVEITPGDLHAFEQRFLIPCLESLCDWWEAMENCQFDPWHSTRGNGKIRYHYQHPYGIYNALAEGGSTTLDDYLASGSEAGLSHCTNLFPELT
jgi:hypothetical protein